MLNTNFMKKILPLLIAGSLLVGCKGVPEKSAAEKQATLDSFTMKQYGKPADDVVKDRVQELQKNYLFDTAGLYKAPIKVLKARPVDKEYSNYRDVYISFKNVSSKTIEGVKFRWYGENAFRKPAELGNSGVPGFGGGFTDETLRPGKTSNGTWEVFSKDAKKIILAWPIEVSFSDGTSWELKP